MTQTVRFIHGTYQSLDLTDLEFPVVEGVQQGAAGAFITVDGRAHDGFPQRNIKITVCDGSYELLGRGGVNMTNETDEEIIQRLRERFDMLEDMTRACKRGDVRAMIVSGPPGVGKSHGVEKVLSRHDIIATLGDAPPKYEVVKGAMSAIGLYCKLYQFAAQDNVIVFDDCDAVLQDDLSLNILKAALDSKKNRRIFWNTDSYKLKNEGVPDNFEFKGSAIFITNIKFDNVKSRKLRDHLEALESRCHYIDLTIDTDREKMLRIRQIVADGMLEDYSFTNEQNAEIVEFVEANKLRLRELSLRTVLKIADLVRAFPSRWQAMAKLTVMK